MNGINLMRKLERVEKIATASKFNRMLMHPLKYFYAIFFREVTYKKIRIEKEVSIKTFFDTEMHILLPSSTDLYLTGGKSHDSEIRLAKFLLINLELGDTFIDVGAHYGYFTLLGSALVGDEGKVFSFEASSSAFKVLSKNSQKKTNIKCINLVVSDEEAELKFYEFPNLYSEYNTLDIDQFKGERWFSENTPRETKIKSIRLNDFLSDEKVYPKVIKIDVEGAEHQVINGLCDYLIDNSPYVIMEYLSQERGNKAHQDAEIKLLSLGYCSCIIDKSGNLKKLDSISKYLADNVLESDNIVFVKQEKKAEATFCT